MVVGKFYQDVLDDKFKSSEAIEFTLKFLMLRNFKAEQLEPNFKSAAKAVKSKDSIELLTEIKQIFCKDQKKLIDWEFFIENVDSYFPPLKYENNETNSKDANNVLDDDLIINVNDFNITEQNDTEKIIGYSTISGENYESLTIYYGEDEFKVFDISGGMKILAILIDGNINPQIMQNIF